MDRKTVDRYKLYLKEKAVTYKLGTLEIFFEGAVNKTGNFLCELWNAVGTTIEKCSSDRSERSQKRS